MGEVSMRTRTCPGPGSGVGNSRTCKTSAGSPKRSKTTAFMGFPHVSALAMGEASHAIRSMNRQRKPPAEQLGEPQNLEKSGFLRQNPQKSQYFSAKPLTTGVKSSNFSD